MALDLAHGPGQPKSQARVLAMQGFLTDSPWSQTDVQHEIQAVFTERLVPSTRRWSVGTVGVIDESGFARRGLRGHTLEYKAMGRNSRPWNVAADPLTWLYNATNMVAKYN